MKLKTIITSICISLCLGSCIQDEAPNAEADIISCVLPDPSILKSDPTITNNSVILMAYSNIKDGIKQIAPSFSLTEGATIYPPNGTVRDFSEPQTYIVTSQDGLWQKEYKVFVDTTNVKPQFSFEHWRIKEGTNGKKWYEFYEITDAGQEQPIWATANPVYAIIGSDDPFTHPTVSYDKGYIGKGVKLETKTTGAFGVMVGMPIAAGNLFIGSFDTQIAIPKPLEATQFGMPMAFNRKPIAFSVWYQYTPGKEFTDKDQNVIENKTDVFDLYAILYESADGKKLDGSINFNEDCIIGIARVNAPEPSKEYKNLYIPFVYRKDPDRKKLSKGEYYMAVVFSSSRNGAYFEGAVGSTLIIDEAKLILEGDNE